MTVVLYHEWRDEYLRRRYLQHASHEELARRQVDLFENILTIDSDGKAIVDAGESLRRLLAHVQAEYQLRGLPFSDSFTQGPYKYHKKAAELWQRERLDEGTYLLKFGNVGWMTRTFGEGVIRIGNAKSYESSSFGPAIQDCEVEFTEEFFGTTAEAVRNGMKIPIETIGNIRRVSECVTDFYIASFGLKYDYRLFDDFSRENKHLYDACLVVRNPEEFLSRMREEGERKLPGWDFYALPVTYRDPYHPTPDRNGIDVFFTKHFRYAYQREFRIVWIPPTAQDKLEPVYFELGPLRDYSQLLML
ncbi:MAG TPA: hypothetical protein VEJ46_01010 [Candidatus Acidoferrum sp.]|nr:hypothetical protein [Candidatus Acidoferrum sp.]